MATSKGPVPCLTTLQRRCLNRSFVKCLDRGVGIWAFFFVTGTVDTNDSASHGMSSLRAAVPPALMLRA
jgi:hypothetical protein